MSESKSSNNLKCPKCGAAKGSDVCDSRAPLEGTYIRRRRKCNACGHKFSTREMVWNDDPSNPNTIKRADILNLRALAKLILNQTNHLMPEESAQVQPEQPQSGASVSSNPR